jgi:hypothetical protein
MNVGNWRKWAARMGLAAVIVCLAVQPVLAAGANPGVLPPQSRSHGATYGEWSARWWQWAYSLPADQNPFFDETGCANGANGQSGSVWFLTGVLNTSGVAERTCTVPTGKALFFPLINVECSTVEAPPFYGADEEELRACAQSFAIADVFATIDGTAVQNLGDPSPYSVESPLFTFTLPENNVLGLPAGEAQSVSSGYYLMLAPLSAGEHTVHFGGRYPDFDFALDITYHLNVMPPGQ